MTEKINSIIFQIGLVLWIILFTVSMFLMKTFPLTANFLAGTILVYTSLLLLYLVFYLSHICSSNLFGVTVWLIFGTLIASVSVMFIVVLFLQGNHIIINGITSILIMSSIMAVASVCFILVYRKKDKKFLERVKVSIYISACIFTIALAIANMYSINITNISQIPSPFKSSSTSLIKVGFSPRNIETYILTLLTFPFLALNAILRTVVEVINYNKK